MKPLTYDVAHGVASRIWLNPFYAEYPMTEDFVDALAHMLMANANGEWLQRQHAGPNACDKPIVR